MIRAVAAVDNAMLSLSWTAELPAAMVQKLELTRHRCLHSRATLRHVTRSTNKYKCTVLAQKLTTLAKKYPPCESTTDHNYALAPNALSAASSLGGSARSTSSTTTGRTRDVSTEAQTRFFASRNGAGFSFTSTDPD